MSISYTAESDGLRDMLGIWQGGNCKDTIARQDAES